MMKPDEGETMLISGSPDNQVKKTVVNGHGEEEDSDAKNRCAKPADNVKRMELISETNGAMVNGVSECEIDSKGNHDAGVKMSDGNGEDRKQESGAEDKMEVDIDTNVNNTSSAIDNGNESMEIGEPSKCKVNSGASDCHTAKTDKQIEKSTDSIGENGKYEKYEGKEKTVEKMDTSENDTEMKLSNIDSKNEKSEPCEKESESNDAENVDGKDSESKKSPTSGSEKADQDEQEKGADPEVCGEEEKKDGPVIVMESDDFIVTANVDDDDDEEETEDGEDENDSKNSSTIDSRDSSTISASPPTSKDQPSKGSGTTVGSQHIQKHHLTNLIGSLVDELEDNKITVKSDSPVLGTDNKNTESPKTSTGSSTPVLREMIYVPSKEKTFPPYQKTVVNPQDLKPKPAPEGTPVVNPLPPTDKELGLWGEAPSNLAPVGSVLFNLGLDLAKERIYKDLIRVQSKRDLQQKEETQLENLKDAHEKVASSNRHLATKLIKCTGFKECNFKTESMSVMIHHLSHPHIFERHGKMHCSYCDFKTKNDTLFLQHMWNTHQKKGYIVADAVNYKCRTCTYEASTRKKHIAHIMKCVQRFDLKRNLEPTGNHHTFSVETRKPPPRRFQPPPPPRPPKAQHTTVAAALQQRAQTNQTFSTSILPTVKGQNVQLYNVNGQYYMLNNGVLVPARNIGNIRPETTPNSGQRQGSQFYMYPATGMILNQPSAAQLPAQYQKRVATAPAPQQPPAKMQRLAADNVAVSANPKEGYEVCELCNGFVKDREALKVHFFFAHQIQVTMELFKLNQPPLSCEVCNRRFWTFQGISKHKSTHLGCTCYICGATLPVHVLPVHCLNTHKFQVHDLLMRNYCPCCGKQSTSETHLHNHLLTFHGVSGLTLKQHALKIAAQTSAKDGSAITLACKLCTAKFFSNTSQMKYVEHCIARHHKIPCCMCDKEFGPSKVVFIAHLQNAHNQYTCQHCFSMFPSTFSLISHVGRAHGKPEEKSSIKCQLCKKRYNLIPKYMEHLKAKHLKLCTVRLSRINLDLYRKTKTTE